MLKSITIWGFLAALGFSPAALGDSVVQNPVPVPRSKPSLAVPLAPQPQLGQSEKQDAAVEFKGCRAALLRLGVEFVSEQPVGNDKGCRVADPLRIISVGSGEGTVFLPAKPVLNCGFALRLAGWLSDIAAPVVGSFSGSSLVSVATGPGYVCRRRNNKKTGKISEHGFGNAIDITSFGLASRKSIKVSVLPGGLPQQVRMLNALRISSCGYFTTVLGPGSNEVHKAHFHLDFAKRGRGWNYRICE